MNRRNRASRSAFTLVEAVLSMVVVGVMLVAAARAVQGSALTQQKARLRSTASLLADGLINDILPLAYEESASPVFGRESGEASSSKSAYDDVDDFAGWTESPPQDRTGAPIPGFAGWTRRVTVERINPADPRQAVGYETGAKRITVTAESGGRVLAQRIAVRTSAP